MGPSTAKSGFLRIWLLRQHCCYLYNIKFYQNPSTCFSSISAESPSIKNTTESPVEFRASSSLSGGDSNITLVCLVRGDPQPQVSWTFNGHHSSSSSSNNNNNNSMIYGTIHNIPKTTPSATSGTIVLVESRLTLDQISFQKHQGTYTCSGQNSFGRSEKSIQMNILGKIFIHLYLV